MNPETFFDNFDVLAEAPNSVQKLRELILQLAVRGKLVAQDERDEPAIELLKRVRSKKGHQSPNKQKIQVPLIYNQQNGIPYDAPIGWEWIKLSEISERVHYGFTASADHSSTAVKLLRITDIQDNQVNWRTVPGCQIEDKEVPKYELHQNDILIARTGGTIGKTFLVEEIPPKAVFASYLIRVIPSPELLARYLKLFLESPFYWEQIRTNSAGTGQPNVNGVALSNLIAPLPPLAEQHRIVSKVDQLMSLCDDLEARQQKKRESRAHINSAVLGRLLAARAPEEFAEGWRRISDNFDLLYDAPENVGALRKAILQLAVMGKLVEQDEKDETASELLKKIKIEKIKLVNNNKIQKDKKPSKISIENMPWEIPSNWNWATLQDAFEISRGGSPRPAGDTRYFGGNIPWITVGEITKDNLKFLESTEDSLTEDGKERSRVIKPNDLLLTNSGATLGVPKISKIEGCINDGVALLRNFHSYDLNDYAYLFLLSQTESFRNVKQGMGQPNLNTSIIADWYFPLPPLAEQRRIVARVDQLMSLCDELEAGLLRSQADSERLMEAVVGRMLAE